MAWHAVPRWGWAEWLLVLASALTHLVYFNVLLKGYRVADLIAGYTVIDSDSTNDVPNL